MVTPVKQSVCDGRDEAWREDNRSMQMKGKNHLSRGLGGAISATLLAAFAVPGPAVGQVRTKSPEEFPGPPYYARIDDAVHTEIVPHDDTTAAIVFYRQPECVPRDFNLLLFFDLSPIMLPGLDFPLPRAYACAMTVEGFELWRNAPPPVDSSPMFASYRGTGNVPVWFVSWPEFLEAAADGVVTIEELEGMASLRRGSASHFVESLHPTGGAINPAISMVAKGKLDDGSSFHLQHSGNVGGRHTRIDID